jgi:hypothetical protein
VSSILLLAGPVPASVDVGPVPELLHDGIVGGAFDAAVPAPVVVGAVKVVFTVRLIVLLLVRREVVQGEAVMVTTLMLLDLAFVVAVGGRLPSNRSAIGLTEPASARNQLRTSSRNRPFHSVW